MCIKLFYRLFCCMPFISPIKRKTTERDGKERDGLERRKEKEAGRGKDVERREKDGFTKEKNEREGEKMKKNNNTLNSPDTNPFGNYSLFYGTGLKLRGELKKDNSSATTKNLL